MFAPLQLGKGILHPPLSVLSLDKINGRGRLTAFGRPCVERILAGVHVGDEGADPHDDVRAPRAALHADSSDAVFNATFADLSRKNIPFVHADTPSASEAIGHREILTRGKYPRPFNPVPRSNGRVGGMA